MSMNTNEEPNTQEDNSVESNTVVWMTRITDKHLEKYGPVFLAWALQCSQINLDDAVNYTEREQIMEARAVIDSLDRFAHAQEEWDAQFRSEVLGKDK